MAKNVGEKITCSKCKTKFYSMGKLKASCPKCQKDNLIPDGSEVQVKLKIRPGGFNDYKLGWSDGMASEGKAGAIYLNCEFSVLTSPHSGKKFYSLIGLRSPKGPWWGNKGRELIRGILDSSRGIDPDDTSPETASLRRLTSLKDLDGAIFDAKVKAQKGDDGRWKNEIDTVVAKESNGQSPGNPAIHNKDPMNAEKKHVDEITQTGTDAQPMWMR